MSGKLKPGQSLNDLKKSAATSNDSEVASIAVRRGQHLLMGRRRDEGKRYTMPGGHLNVGEKPVEGAARELFEEAGIKAHPGELKHVGTEDVTTFTGKKKRIHAYIYEHKGELPVTHHDPDEEVEKWEWIDCGKGLPEHVRANLHSPKNMLLQRLGLLPKEMRKAEDHWAFNEWLEHEDAEARDKLPMLEGKKFEGALKELAQVTSARVNPKTKHTEFLLHRGHHKDDPEMSDPQTRTSWTPRQKVAKEFAQKAGRHGRVTSAWIPRGWIATIPKHHVTEDTHHRNRLEYEHEVVVNPHPFKLQKALETGQSLNDLNKAKLPKFDARKVPAEHRQAATSWVLHSRGATRETLPRLEGPARERALRKLGGATKTRFNTTTREREFLLHRGVSKEEAASALQGQHVRHDKMTSWTPDGATAHAFAQDYGQGRGRGRRREKSTLSAWIPESRIHHVPAQIGYVKRTGAMASIPNRDEHEVVVDSHRSQAAHPDEAKTAFDYKQTLDSRISAKGGFGRPSQTYEHMRPLKQWMKKTETLQKSPLIDDQDDRYTNGVLETGVGPRERLASKTKLGDRLWHHHYTEDRDGATMHHHYLTDSASAPEYEKNLIGYMYGTADKKTGHLHVYESAVEPHLQRRGYGTAMYRQAAKIHGGLVSGMEHLSSAASSIYHKLAKDPEFKAKLAPEVEHDDIEDESVSNDEINAAERSHRLKYVGPKPVKK